jgi:hypothetical protein
MIPSGLLTYELSKKILQTGKAVNFIRRCCQEQDWILDASMHAMPSLDARQLINTGENGETATMSSEAE